MTETSKLLRQFLETCYDYDDRTYPFVRDESPEIVYDHGVREVIFRDARRYSVKELIWHIRGDLRLRKRPEWERDLDDIVFPKGWRLRDLPVNLWASIKSPRERHRPEAMHDGNLFFWSELAEYARHWDCKRTEADTAAKRQVLRIIGAADDLTSRAILFALAQPYKDHPEFNPDWLDYD